MLWSSAAQLVAGSERVKARSELLLVNRLADARATSSEFSACSLKVGDNEVQAAGGPWGGRGEVGPELNRAARAGSGDLDQMEAITSDVSVNSPAEMLVEVLCPIDVGDRDDDDPEFQVDRLTRSGRVDREFAAVLGRCSCEPRSAVSWNVMTSLGKPPEGKPSPDSAIPRDRRIVLPRQRPTVREATCQSRPRATSRSPKPIDAAIADRLCSPTILTTVVGPTDATTPASCAISNDSPVGTMCALGTTRRPIRRTARLARPEHYS